MAGRPRPLARQLGMGALRVAELAVVVAGGCLAVSVLLSWVLGRGFGRTAALVCALVGAGMMFGGSWRNAPVGVLDRRRRRLLDERRRQDERDPAARARREVEEREPPSVVSPGGVASLAGIVVIAAGFAADALLGHGR
ncbi:MAG TPA: hypothetical protein VEP73_07640 [Actinomycetota bacterium]|nr:hypothetical protein [Actinomycetota bacterium]